ncbi:MAG: sodium-translocating pyrophosphatase, partial [Piscirickettsiaceae bacterium]|nr:sodium-translocating pyrophosphatase [Piscirickettsiaceae bacterium]
MSVLSFVPILFGILGLYCAYLVYGLVMKSPPGSGKVVDIGDQIHLGAMVFMKAEYSRLAIFSTVVLL